MGPPSPSLAAVVACLLHSRAASAAPMMYTVTIERGMVPAGSAGTGEGALSVDRYRRRRGHEPSVVWATHSGVSRLRLSPAIGKFAQVGVTIDHQRRLR